MHPWSKHFAVFFLVALLAGCASVTERAPTLPEALGAITVEITAAANTLADAADVGAIDRQSDWYQTLKEGLESAALYVEAAWSYYLDGNYMEANAARNLALQTYGKVRESLRIVEARLLEAQ